MARLAMLISAVRERERNLDAALWRGGHRAAARTRARYVTPAWQKFKSLSPLQRIVVVTAAMTIMHFGIGLTAYVYEACFQLMYDLTLRRLVSEAFFLARSGRCIFPLIVAGCALRLNRDRPRLAMLVLVCVLTVMGVVAMQDFASHDLDYWKVDGNGNPTDGTYLTWWWRS